MSVSKFSELLQHKGHTVNVNVYGDYYDPVNVAIECENCYEVLLDFDREEEDNDA